jgi:hypothetical protein
MVDKYFNLSEKMLALKETDILINSMSDDYFPNKIIGYKEFRELKNQSILLSFESRNSIDDVQNFKNIKKKILIYEKIKLINLKKFFF